MIAFTPNEDQELMQRELAGFASTLRARMRDAEKERAVPEDLRKQAFERGLAHVAIPESAGGAGLGLVTQVILEEEVAAGDPGAPFAFGGPGNFGRAVLELGTEAQATDLLANLVGSDAHARFGAVAWSERHPHKDRAGMTTRAVKDGEGYRLDGAKAFVLNGDRAERFVVFAQVDESAGWNGLGAFVVDRGASGLKITSRETTLGLDVASVAGLELTGVKVPASARLEGNGDFAGALLRFFTKSALVVAARAVGLSRAAFDVTLAYCQERKAFGKPVGHFQAIAFALADRAMDVDASRALVWRAASAWDTGDAKALLHSAYAISYALEAAMRCGDDAVQLHGGAGFMRDYPVEKFMRDAKQLQLAVMTAEQADQLAAALVLGQKPSLELVLPHAESQSTIL